MLVLLFVATQSQLTLQAQENWRDSLTAINKQIAESQWSTELHLRKANANLQLQQWQYAIDEYGLVLRHEERNPAALFYRAYAYTHMRRFDLARHVISKDACRWQSYCNKWDANKMHSTISTS